MVWPPPQFCYADGVRRLANPRYKNLRAAWLNLLQNQAPGIQAGGVCYGDSGGPVFWTNDDGTETLVGITSWGDANCVANANYYRVDIPDTMDFIEDVMGDKKSAPPRFAYRTTATSWGSIKSSH
jgi:secreted trypsin-like serine protease